MRRHPRSVLLATSILVVATTVGCSEEKPNRRAATYLVDEDDHYVALGDSYTAAPKTGDLTKSSGCGQTNVNYPHRIAEATGVQLDDNSCNGASTLNLTQPKLTGPLGPADPQLDDLDKDTDLVTIRLGANDYSLIGRIFACASIRDAAALPGTPCADIDAARGPDAAANRLRDVHTNLDAGLDDIQGRAPDAQIVVIGYPQLIPAEGTCDLLPLPAGDYDYAREIMSGLNEALQGAADDHDAIFIDMYPPSEGHDICSDDPWMAGGLDLDNPPVGATAWHPYAAESQAVAGLVLDALRG